MSLYSSAPVGYLGGIMEKTNVEAILQFDLLKTDFFHEKGYPSYLFYNPYDVKKKVEMNLGAKSCDVYDTVSNKFIATSVKGKFKFTMPAHEAMILVLVPAKGKIIYEGKKTLVNGIVVDYNNK